ncbi:hypothetical protein E2R51_10800 [Jeotgalibacillus sp. S-D1]|uniref:beta-propeller domain-containing protein n=1 Tax=Jeotgalibacillus sp. S-D1 TaxID=2552189 RepID=UPI00105A04A7|nr:beta-propeller domain-containing protein [Jeotgalibacillus sp. S-D1]TDL33130.1 hypothetical protein E2R51_10800 [Jeotgalibacillus sp. S-D1]
MNKKNWITAAVLVVLATGLGLIIFYMQPEVKGAASGQSPNYVFTDKEWKLQFTKPLNKETINEKSVYVLNKENERVAVQVAVNQSGTTLSITSPENGYQSLQEYTLHLSDQIKSRMGLGIRGNQAIPFQVINELPAVESVDFLKDYFTSILKSQKSQDRNFFSTQTETSEDSAGAGETADSVSGGGEGDYSQTNNQVEGVNEADIVQTDGEFIFHINNDQDIEIVKAEPEKSLDPAATIDSEENFYPSQLFLSDQKLIVIGEKVIPHSDKRTSREEYVMDKSVTAARIYDVSNQLSPKLEREVGTEGYFNNARMIDSTLYFITVFTPNIWLMEDFPDIELRPQTMDSSNGDNYQPVNVEDISIIPDVKQSQYSIVTAVDVSDPDSEVTTETYLGGGGQVYMSDKSLYLAASNQEYSIMPMDIMPVESDQETTIYKFDIDGVNVGFAAKGTVRGSVLNQFSMDEHDGHLRVATTEGNTFGNDRSSTNNLFILNEKMEQTGSVEGLAKGERIYSARFMGDKAYMVTFRETDPLFVIDVASPEKPEVLGELKIPGFSTYLHPLDENHLIGFGLETEVKKSDAAGDPPIVTQAGMKISLFDITDFANPKEKDVEVIGGPGTFSPLMNDHKALFHHKDRSLFGFPIVVYDQQGQTGDMNFINQGALIYTITAENGIQLASELYDEKQKNQQYEDWDSEIKRMIYIGETVYTVRGNGVQAHNLPE